MQDDRKPYAAGAARVCRKCLIPDYIEDKEQFLATYIQGIEEENRTDEQEYERRLGLCDACEQLMNGVCRHCGCFVAIRAAVAKNYCPSPKKKW